MCSALYADPLATWNSRYEGEEYRFGTEPNEWLAERAAHFSPGQRALCVADGEGRNSAWLAGMGVVVDAFDLSPVGVAKARKLAASRSVQVNYAVCDCEDYAWQEESHDHVVAVFVQFADPEGRARLFERMKASVKPGGLILLLGYTPKQLDYGTGGPKLLSHLYTADLLRESFAGFEMLELAEFEAEVDEGAGHRGMSAMVGMVARRA